MSKEKLIILMLVFFPLNGLSQQFLNFDFERKSVEGISRPWGWELDSFGHNPFSLDSNTVKHGMYSLKVKADSLHSHLPGLQYNIEPFFIKNKKFTLSGYVNPRVINGESTISVGYTLTDSTGNFSDNSNIVYTVGDHDGEWKKIQFSYKIPDEATSVYIRIHIQGTGTVWYDNFKIILDGEEFDEIPVAVPFSKAEYDWIEKNSIPFGQIKEINEEPFSFNFFRNSVNDSRIVALGESTHGTSEFFTLKHQIFKYLVEKEGFRVFALEDNQLSCERVNQYVLGTLNVNAEEAMSKLFAVWYTEEMKLLVEWIKEWNSLHPEDPVFFAGFDMQDYKLPLYALTNFLEDHDSDLLTYLDGFDEFGANHFNKTDSTKEEWLAKTQYIYEQLTNSEYSSPEFQIELQNATLLKQFTENVLKGHWTLYRDKAMAENVTWLANIRFPNQKIFIWAHDVHISKSTHKNDLYNLNFGIAMGHFLEKDFDSDYKMYGLMTYSGAYLALKSYTNFERVHSPLYPSPIGSLSEALHQISIEFDEPNLFIDFMNSESWMSRPLPFRFANHVNIDYGFFQRVSLPDQFDGIFFIDKTNPSTYIKH